MLTCNFQYDSVSGRYAEGDCFPFSDWQQYGKWMYLRKWMVVISKIYTFRKMTMTKEPAKKATKRKYYSTNKNGEKTNRLYKHLQIKQ